eukprot:TRINITY_DN3054_c0_g1_i4.p1 TRINITY_DN3054_c0_g1~~TRINITY_DN3054_c0_g1_i4.p1  ORF type:complete len:266 (-),score=59.77 TRINITY_DN3054_c0_g1_i4:207-1004(-)
MQRFLRSKGIIPRTISFFLRDYLNCMNVPLSLAVPSRVQLKVGALGMVIMSRNPSGKSYHGALLTQQGTYAGILGGKHIEFKHPEDNGIVEIRDPMTKMLIGVVSHCKNYPWSIYKKIAGEMKTVATDYWDKSNEYRYQMSRLLGFTSTTVYLAGDPSKLAARAIRLPFSSKQHIAFYDKHLQEHSEILIAVLGYRQIQDKLFSLTRRLMKHNPEAESSSSKSSTSASSSSTSSKSSSTSSSSSSSSSSSNKTESTKKKSQRKKK